MEQRIELRGLRAQAADPRQVALVARQRRQAGQAAVLAAVVDLLEPGPQPRIEVVQIGDAALVELAQELFPDGAMPAFELALAPRADKGRQKINWMPSRAHRLCSVLAR